MKRLLCVGLILYTATLAYAKEPKWFGNKTPSAYPITEYIIGFGSASSGEEAFTAAQAQIASQIETTIHSTTTITEYELQTASSIKSEQTHESVLVSETLKNLQGIDIVKREKSDGTFYIMATLSKKSFLSGLSKDLDTLKKDIEAKQKKAKTEELKRNIQKAITLYDELSPKCKKYHQTLTLFNALSTSKLTTTISTSEHIDSQLSDMLDSFSITVKSGNNQTSPPAEELENPIVFYVTYKDLPFANAPVAIHYSDGTAITEGKTDEDGLLPVRVLAVPFPVQQTIVNATLLINTPSRLKDNLSNGKASALYSLAFSEISTLQLVPINNPSDTSLASLFTLIESYGITWSKDSPFVLEAELEDENIASISGSLEPQYLASVTWILRVRLQNGNSLGTMRVKGQSLNKNREKAQLEAYKKLDLSKTKLYELLSKITKAKGLL